MSVPYHPVVDLIDFTKIIKLKVGQPENQETFYAFPSILASRSRFFKAALKDCWEEGFSGEIALPEDDPQVVHHYLHFAQAARTPLSFIWLPCEHSSEIPSNKRDAQDLLTQQLKLYIFADKVQDLSTKLAVIRCLAKLQAYYQMNYHALFPDQEQVWMVYENTVKGDEARRFVVDVFARRGEERGENALDEVCGGDFPPEFWLELAQALVKLRAEPASEYVLLDDEEYVQGSNGTTEESVVEVADGGGAISLVHRWRVVWEEWCRILQHAKAMSARVAGWFSKPRL